MDLKSSRGTGDKTGSPLSLGVGYHLKSSGCQVEGNEVVAMPVLSCGLKLFDFGNIVRLTMLGTQFEAA